jgi:hypothetical protein
MCLYAYELPGEPLKNCKELSAFTSIVVRASQNHEINQFGRNQMARRKRNRETTMGYNLPLTEMSFKEALSLDRALSGMTFAELHEATGIPKETCRRYFHDLKYNPNPANLPELCNAMDSYIAVQWICRRCGGVFVKLEGLEKVNDIQEAVGKLTVEFGEFLKEHGEAVKDGKITYEELQRIGKELEDVLIKAAEMMAFVQSQLKKMAREGE